MADIINTIIREIIVVSTDDGKKGGLATVILYGIEALVVFGVLSPLYVGYMIYSIYASKKINDDDKLDHYIVTTLILSAQTFASMLYFYGDNINYIMERYGEDLGCGEKCVNNNRIAAVVLLGLSLMLFHVVPATLRKIAKMCGIKQEQTGWNSALDMVVVIVKIDTVFTTVAIMAQTDEFCNLTDISLSSSFVVISFLVGLYAMIVNGLYSCSKLDEISKCVTLAFFLLLFCFPMYLLADNQQPIGCAFRCDTFAANMTLNDINCNTTGNAVLRIGFMAVTLLTTIAVPSGLLYCSISNKVRPKAGII